MGWPPWEECRDRPVTDTAPINPLQQSISALNNICNHEIRVLQSLTRILERTSALCSTHTYLCFTDRSHTSQNTLAAIIHVYVCEYRGFREEGKPKMEKTRGCHCNLPLWEKSEIGLCRGSTTPFPWSKAEKLQTMSHNGANRELYWQTPSYELPRNWMEHY